MSLPNKLQSARMIDATPGASIDNKVGELEQSICDILGLPLDTQVTIAVTAIDATGRLTATIRYAAAQDPTNATPVAAGPRIRDTANDDEALLVVEDGYLRVYSNTGTETVPVWTERNKMALATGMWDVTGTAATDLPACRSHAISTQNFTSSTDAAVNFGVDKFDQGDIHDVSANISRFTFSEAGIYMISGMVEFMANGTGYRMFYFRKNGSVWAAKGTQLPGSTPSTTVLTASVILEFAAGDYVEIVAFQDSGADLVSLSAECSCAMLR